MNRTWVFIVGLIIVSSCASSKKSTSSSIKEIQWVLETLNGRPVDYDSNQAKPYLVFSGEKVNGFGGCNKFFGGYSVDGNSIDFGMLGSTKMSCISMDLEGELFRVLEEARLYDVKNEKLELFDNDKLIASFVKGH